MPSDHPIDHLRAALASIHKGGNGSYLVSDGEGAVAIVTRNFGGTAWERALAESAVGIIADIREAIKRSIAEGHGGDIADRLRSDIALEIGAGDALDEVIRLAAGGSDAR
jgi:hypothetical protein